ncbi:hypothetical protein ABE10_01635, partial [Bacillus toyonensis]|nr:hypothetical protein [Bacillus toyonensis]
DVASETGIDEPCGRMRDQAQTPERGLPLQTRGDVVGKGDPLERRAEGELPRMQDERLVRRDLDEAGQLGLVLRRIDEGVLVVVEQPEVAVQAHIDARRLDHRGFERVEPDPSLIEP